jgi:hypothetical protein
MIWNLNPSAKFDRFFQAAENVWGIEKDELRMRTRKEPIASARAILMAVIRRRTGATFEDIALALGRREHGTAMHHCEQHEPRMEVDADYRENAQAIEEELDKEFGHNVEVPDASRFGDGYFIDRKTITTPAGGFTD